jgi:hypothetical protein
VNARSRVPTEPSEEQLAETTAGELSPVAGNFVGNDPLVDSSSSDRVTAVVNRVHDQLWQRNQARMVSRIGQVAAEDSAARYRGAPPPEPAPGISARRGWQRGRSAE